MDDLVRKEVNILIVDDDKAIADILMEYLQGEERTVNVCYDGLTAAQTIQKESFDLVIADMLMPGLSGLDILRQAKKTNPETMVIIITGYASLETAILAVREGAYDYIRKPFKLEEIKIVVEKAIDKIFGIRENQFLLRKLKDAYQELVRIKQEKKEDRHERTSTVNFFPSNMATLPYMYESGTVENDGVDKIQAISSLKQNGFLSDSEFEELKKHLIKQMTSDD